MVDDPSEHFLEFHQLKTVCYECPWCAQAEVLKHKFTAHVSQHEDFDSTKFNIKSCLARDLAPFRELALCRTCGYTARTARIVDKHRVSHKPPAPAQFCVRAPPRNKPTFPNADPERLEALEKQDEQIRELKQEAEQCAAEKTRRLRQPEVYGVFHGVSLRGDLLCHTGAAYAHVMFEQFVLPGDYHLCKHQQRVDVTVRYHHACPAVTSREIDPASENPRFFTLSGLLHAARGTPVVWYVVSVAQLVSQGEWLLVQGGGTPVSRVTVDSERVLQ